MSDSSHIFISILLAMHPASAQPCRSLTFSVRRNGFEIRQKIQDS